MQLSFRHSNYRATLSQPNADENLIQDFVQPDNPSPSNHPISKYVTSKTIIRPALAADDSNFYDDEYDADEELTIFDEDDDELYEFDGDDEELTEFDGDDEEFIVFDEEDDELMVLDEEDVISYENDEDPACSTIPNEESSTPDTVITIRDEPPTDHENKATTSTLYWNNPYKGSSTNYQKYSYWNKQLHGDVLSVKLQCDKDTGLLTICQ